MAKSHRAASTQTRRKVWLLWLVAAVCAAPAIASYMAYYIFKPTGAAVNYGTLLEPQRPVPATLTVRTEHDGLVPMRTLTGKWLMLMVDASACTEDCVKKLYFMRQVRATQGNERERVDTLWLRTDNAPVAATITSAYPDIRLLQADANTLANWLPAEANTAMTDHIYLIDPSGNLMMRFPKEPDPTKIKKDLSKLLKWSGIG